MDREERVPSTHAEGIERSVAATQETEYQESPKGHEDLAREAQARKEEPSPKAAEMRRPRGPGKRKTQDERRIEGKKKKGKKEVATDGAKRGGVEGVVVFALTQLALSYGAPAEVTGYITEANVALLAGAATVVIRVAEALIADGRDEVE